MYGRIYGKAAPVRLYDATLSLAALFDRLLAWQERARSRRMLRGLDDHMLRDIGIDRGLAEQEGSVPFWR